MFLGIIHREIAQTTPAPAEHQADGVRWRTCLREVVFLERETPASAGRGAQPMRGAEAYAFLLETICGLHSRMLGETQVLGQFRAFLASLSPVDAPWLDAVGQQLIADARAIRERHLRGLGSRSYGSAVRRYLTGAETVTLVGAGALARELLPYLSEGRRVDRWTRQDVAGAPGRAASPAPAVLVIAAPLRAGGIEAVARCYTSLIRIVDLRDAEARDVLSIATPVISLDDVFADVAATSAAVDERVESARREIQGMAAAFERRHQLRPFGWDDLCA
ncbi:MAG: hypothetical protein WD690_06875 [Vicinamibacterales bacterium]